MPQYLGGSHEGAGPRRPRAQTPFWNTAESVSGRDAQQGSVRQSFDADSVSREQHGDVQNGFENYGVEQHDYEGHGIHYGEQQLKPVGRWTLRNPLRVIVVFPCLLRGGAEQWLVYLTKFLDPKRVVIQRCVVTNGKAIDPEFAKEMPIPVEVQQADSIERAVRECDVLFVFGLPLNTLLGSSRPKLCVFTAHGSGNWTKGLLDRAQGICDHAVAVSQMVKESTCGNVPTTVVLNGVDAARLAATRSRESSRRHFGYQNGDFVLGYMGRFSPEKQVDLLIRAVGKLPSRYKLLLVGWGPLRGTLMDLANELIPGRYAFTTATDYLGDYYGAMDALGLVSAMEGCSLALLEAMMCNLPVVVTPVGSVPEMIIDGTSGVVVKPDASSIAQAVRRLGENPKWAAGVAAEGQRFANEHGHAARMARDYEALLYRLWRQKFGSAQ